MVRRRPLCDTKLYVKHSWDFFLIYLDAFLILGVSIGVYVCILKKNIFHSVRFHLLTHAFPGIPIIVNIREALAKGCTQRNLDFYISTLIGTPVTDNVIISKIVVEILKANNCI